MKCEKAQELFSDYYESALEQPMAVAFEEHIHQCSKCADEYAGFKLTWNMLGTLPEIEPPRGFASGVLVKLYTQQQEALKARSRWQVFWNDWFAPKLPAKAFAAGAIILILALGCLGTPMGDGVRAWLFPAPVIDAAKSNTPATADHWTKPAEAWLSSGLTFALDPSSRPGMNVFRMLVTPKDVESMYVRVFLMHPDSRQLGRASLVFGGDVRAPGQVIPFIIGDSGSGHEVNTTLIEWTHRGRLFQELVFVPTHLDSPRVAIGDIYIENANIYDALRTVSATYSTVILANGDFEGVVQKAVVTGGNVDDALHAVLSGLGLRWRALGGRVYMIERIAK